MPKLLEVTPRIEGPSHLLTARALEVQMPLGSAAAVRCDLVATSSEPLSRLLGAGAPEGEHSIVAPPCLPVVQSAPRAAPAAPTAAATTAAAANAAAAAAATQTAPAAQVAVPAPAPPELPAGVLALLQQLHGQVAALTARAQEQEDTIAALTAKRTEPPTPVASSTVAAGGPQPQQRQPPPERSQQAQQLADLSSQIAAEQQHLAAELHELRQRAADPAAESRQPGSARPTGPDGEEVPPYSYLLMREAHGDGEEDCSDDAGRDADGDYADGEADDTAWLPASALMAVSEGEGGGDSDGDGDGDGDGKCGGGGGGEGGEGGGGGLAALNPASGGPATECSDDPCARPSNQPRASARPVVGQPRASARPVVGLALHSTLHTPHSILHTPHSTLFPTPHSSTLHSAPLHTPHSTPHSTLHSTPRSTPPGTLPCTPPCTPLRDMALPCGAD